MIKFHARKPVRDFLNAVTDPPYSLPTDKQNMFFESILEVYEESTNKERQDFLCADTSDLLRAFVDEDRAINKKAREDTHRLSKIEISSMLWGLIAAANKWGVRLPNSEINKYEKLDFGIGSFAQCVRAIYKPKGIHKRPASCAGTSAPAGSCLVQQPTAPDGSSIFTDCIADPYRDKHTIVEAELKKVLKDKKGKAAIILFVACYINGILRQCPSHQQALFLSESIGKAHGGYNNQKKIYFSEEEEGKRINGNTAIYNVLNQTKTGTIREEILKAETELKTLFDSLEISASAPDGSCVDSAGQPAPHQHDR